MKQNRDKTILILGGGFGGVYAFLEACGKFKDEPSVEIILISENDRFLFVPMLHEVATGNLLPSSITQPLRTMVRGNGRVLRGRVNKVDLDGQKVFLEDSGAPGIVEIKYDYLVSAIGSDTHFFGTPGTPENVLTLKDLQDARKLKNRMIECFERALWAENEERQKGILHFVIVGGGPTGVELAGEMADFLNRELTRAFPKLCPKARVTLIQSGDKLLNQANVWFHRQAEKILTGMRVEIMYNKRVSRVEGGKVFFGEDFMAAETVIWTAGVKANSLALLGAKKVEPEERSGRIKVNEFLQIPEYPNAFVVGDQAWICDKENEHPYPMRAQFASREGKAAAQNIYRLHKGRALTEFEWKDQGFIVSLGKGGALAEVYGIRFSGFIAWWMYRTAYLLKLVGMRAKIRTAIEWSLNLFLPRDVSKL